MPTRRYYVFTWDMNIERWTPQEGVRCGPYSQFGLRKPLRSLRGMGYDINRHGAFSVLVTTTRKPKNW